MDDEALATELKRALGRYQFDQPLATVTRSRARTRLPMIAGAAAVLAIAAVAMVALLRPGTPFGPSAVFASWQAVPTQPNPALVAGGPARCGTTGSVVTGGRSVIIDQRGAAAALMLATPADAVVCLLTIDSSGAISSAVSGVTHLSNLNGTVAVGGVLTRPATTDYPGVTVMSGEAAAAVATVKVSAGSLVVTASVKNGYFLAWWPSDVPATDVVGLDQSGQVLGHAASPTN